jgi:scyllo-inositol 2-dehydrogenase (NADP+)
MAYVIASSSMSDRAETNGPIGEWFTRVMVTSQHRPLSVVVVGYGLGGRVFHAPLVEATPGLSLDAIVTSNPERAAQASASHPQAAIYGTADEAWAAGHDLACISTANVTHVPFATAALEAGLHVVLDKPIAPTAEAAQALAGIAARMDRRLIPFQNRRWDSDFLTARAIDESRQLGLLHRFESRIERMRVKQKPGWRGSADPADMGGMLYDLGAHLVDQALLLMGPVVLVSASLRSLRPDDDTDDDVAVQLTHASGAVSMLVASQVGAFGDPRMTLFGTRGGLRIDASDSQEAALVAGADLRSGGWGVEPAGSEALLRTYDEDSTPTESRVPLVPGSWPVFYAGVEAALSDGAPDPVELGDVIANLRVLDAAREASDSGRVVRLDPPAGHR